MECAAGRLNTNKAPHETRQADHRSHGADAMTPQPYFEAQGITLYCGDCREILPHLGHVDHIITDPPYSRRTHDGHNASSSGHTWGGGNDGSERLGLGYQWLDERDCRIYSELFHASCGGWIVWMTDHSLAPIIMGELECGGRYVFAPLPFFAPGSRVRLSGDGPSSWTDWIIVSRTTAQARWGTLPGGYVSGQGPEWHDKQWIGGKPSALMGKLVRDYSRDGEIVCDPFMGAGTTVVAARNSGRRAIGIDISEEACAIAAGRLRQGVLLGV